MKCFARLRKSFIELVLVGLLTSMAAAEPPNAEVIKGLGAKDFKTRDASSKKLLEWANQRPEESPAELYQVWKKSSDPEVKARCFTVIREVFMKKNAEPDKGYLGVTMREIFLPQAKTLAIMLTSIQPNTPADKNGLLAGDVVNGVDKLNFSAIKAAPNEQVALEKFRTYIKKKRPGEKITLHISRKGKKIEKTVTLAKRAEELDDLEFGRDPGVRRRLKELEFKKFLKQQAAK